FLSLVMGLALFLAACSGKEQTSSDDPKGPAEKEKKDTEQVLIYARGGDSTSLDFASVSDGESSRVTRNIYESLLEYEKDSFEIKPGLAHDWEISDDGLTY